MRPEVAEASMQLATEGGYPVLTASNRFVHDARCAWLIEALEDHLESNWKPRVRKGWFSASALGKTDEQLIAEYRGEVDPDDAPPAKLLRVFAVGNSADKRYKKLLSDAGLSVVGSARDRRVKLVHLRLQGECDDILRGPDGFVVYEGKTMNSYSFGRLEAPLPHHVDQVHCYMAGLSIHDGAIISYECKDNQELRMFWVDWQPERWDAIAARLRRLRAEAEASG